jgi:hypothetical protein
MSSWCERCGEEERVAVYYQSLCLSLCRMHYDEYMKKLDLKECCKCGGPTSHGCANLDCGRPICAACGEIIPWYSFEACACSSACYSKLSKLRDGELWALGHLPEPPSD